MKPVAFTIRVYGLLIHQGQILLSRENIHGDLFTKFPGGGLEFGESIIDCIKREFMEEVGITLSSIKHFYTTEGYFPSAFHNPPKQVLSIYYKVSTEELDKIKTEDPTKLFLLKEDEDQILYWCYLDKLGKQGIELPIDKIVVEKILAF